MKAVRRLTVVATTLALTFALVACGSGGGSDTISRAAFLKQAKAICTKGTTAIDAVYSRYAGGKHIPKNVNRNAFMNKVAAEIVIPVRKKEVRELRALELPVVGRRRLEMFLEAMEDGIKEGEEDHQALRGLGTKYVFYRAIEMSDDVHLEECFIG
ncbi:MAG TPA: hypothetical protein VFS64_00605 [Solirubrobacterales bacterium]|nr:hypothetical protein [Solirubrobacterales bacterium]